MLIPSDRLKDLTEAAVRKDSGAINMLFEYFRPALYAQALNICGNTPLAQESLQDTFIKAFHHLHHLRQTSNPYPWLKKILVNTCYRNLKKERSWLLQRSGLIRESQIRNSMEEHMEQKSDHQRLYHSMSMLSNELNSCILLRYFSDYASYEEIATILGIPVGTVRSRLAAARGKLSLFYHAEDDAGEKAILESRSWSAYYREIWQNIYDDAMVRNHFYNHLDPLLDIRFTSGKTGHGRNLLEYEIGQDLIYGTRFIVQEVISAGSITIIQGDNSFIPDYPDRCAPHSVFVLFRRDKTIGQLKIYDSVRPVRDKII